MIVQVRCVNLNPLKCKYQINKLYHSNSLKISLFSGPTMGYFGRKRNSDWKLWSWKHSTLQKSELSIVEKKLSMALSWSLLSFLELCVQHLFSIPLLHSKLMLRITKKLLFYSATRLNFVNFNKFCYLYAIFAKK